MAPPKCLEPYALYVVCVWGAAALYICSKPTHRGILENSSVGTGITRALVLQMSRHILCVMRDTCICATMTPLGKLSVLLVLTEQSGQTATQHHTGGIHRHTQPAAGPGWRWWRCSAHTRPGPSQTSGCSGWRWHGSGTRYLGDHIGAKCLIKCPTLTTCGSGLGWIGV